MGYVDLEVVGVQIGVGHLKIRREVLLVLVLVRLWKDGGEEGEGMKSVRLEYESIY